MNEQIQCDHLWADINYWSGFYLHWVDDDGEGRVVPLAAALLSSAPGAFTATMDGANSENTQDHHDNQKTHTHHYDDGSCSWYHCKKQTQKKHCD